MAGDIQGQRHDRSALVLYGSETGNSQEVAEDLGRMTERLHFRTRVCEMDQVEINILPNYTVVIFAISTTGQGEFPSNARKFWKSLLRKRLPPNCLGHVVFTSFGLGDSSYPQYNFSARKLHKRLEQLGAKEFYPRGEADEQHEQGIDGTFLSWSVDLRKHLLSQYPLPDGIVPIPKEVLLPPKFILALRAEPPPPTTPPLQTVADMPIADFLFNRRPIGPALPQSAGTLFSKPGTPEHDLALENLRFEANKKNRQPSPPSEVWIDPETLAEPKQPEEKPKNPYHYDYDLTLPHLNDDPVACSQLREPFDGESHHVADPKFPSPRFISVPDGFNMRLVENKRMTPPDHWQDVRQLTFLASDENVYEPGDIINIWPKNFPEDVQTLIDLQGWGDFADRHVTFEPVAPDFYGADNLLSTVPGLFPTHNPTLRDLLTHNLDFTAIPKRYFFEIISLSTNDPMHIERLQDFANPVYTDEFYDYTSRPRRSILEVLQDFPSVKLDWQRVCTYFPLIRPRKFSICSGGSLKFHPRDGVIKVQLLVAIVKYKTVLKKVRQGLCSRYLAALPVQTLIQVTFGMTNLGLEICRPHKPLILVGPGTGIAPCRSLIFERANFVVIDKVTHIADTILFYGGRNKEKDYFYEDEWAFENLNLTNVYTAFSRDQLTKIYVQDVIRREKEEVWRMIKSGAIIMVSGSSGKMPKAVREAFIFVMLDQGGEKEFPNGRADVEDTLKEMEKQKFYVQETW